MENLRRVEEFVIDKLDERFFPHKNILGDMSSSDLKLAEELYRLKLENVQEDALDSSRVATRVTVVSVSAAFLTGINGLFLSPVLNLGWGLVNQVKVGYCQTRYQKVLNRMEEVSDLQT